MEISKYGCSKCQTCSDKGECEMEDVDFYDKEGRLRVYITLKNKIISSLLLYDINRNSILEEYYEE
jgi:hypothetical protein